MCKWTSFKTLSFKLTNELRCGVKAGSTCLVTSVTHGVWPCGKLCPTNCLSVGLLHARSVSPRVLREPEMMWGFIFLFLGHSCPTLDIFFCPKGGLNGSADLVHAPHICLDYLLLIYWKNAFGQAQCRLNNKSRRWLWVYLMDSEMVTDKAAVYWFYFIVNVFLKFFFNCQGRFRLSLIVFSSVYLFFLSLFSSVSYSFYASEQSVPF